MALAAPLAATLGSTSSSTITGDLPPSSSETRAMLSMAALPISLPTAVEPVKAILSTPGCAASAAPAVGPVPVITFSAPLGNPASSAHSARRSAVSGVSSAGFNTMLQPVASAGPTFHTVIISGKFHGMMAPTTPTGSRRV